MTVIFSVACEFESDNIFNSPIEQNIDNPEIQVIQLNLNNNNDTIYLYTHKSIAFSFQSDKQKIHGVELMIDNESKQIIENAEGKFEDIPWYSLEEGIHKLTLNIYTSSGSGSIADQLRMENFLLSKNWILIVDKTYYQKTIETTSDGIFSMTWPKCKSPDFKEFVITKYDGYSNSTEISRQSNTTFRDPSYAGEQCSYNITAVSEEGEIHWGGLQMEKNIPRLFFESSTNNTYTLKHSTSKYYGGIDSVVIEERERYANNYKAVKQTAYTLDTTYLITNKKFADEINYQIRIVPRNTNSLIKIDPYHYQNCLEIQLGYVVDPESYWLEDLSQISPTEFIFSGYQDTLKRFSTQSLKITEQNIYQIKSGCWGHHFSRVEVSSTGKTLSANVGCDPDILITPTDIFDMNNIRNMSFLTGKLYSPPIPISDVGIGVIQSHKLNTGFYLYDFNKSVIVGQSDYHTYSVKINSTANYLYISGGSKIIAHFKDGYFTKIWESQCYMLQYNYFEFDALNPNHAYIWDGTTLMVKDCSSFKTINSYKLSDKNLCHIDFHNRRLLTYNNYSLIIRNLEDGHVLEEVPISEEVIGYGEQCYLINNCIIHKDGYIYFLSNYSK